MNEVLFKGTIDGKSMTIRAFTHHSPHFNTGDEHALFMITRHPFTAKEIIDMFDGNLENIELNYHHNIHPVDVTRFYTVGNEIVEEVGGENV